MQEYAALEGAMPRLGTKLNTAEQPVEFSAPPGASFAHGRQDLLPAERWLAADMRTDMGT